MSCALTSLEGVDAVFVLAGQHHHRPSELATSGHLSTLKKAGPEPHRNQRSFVLSHPVRARRARGLPIPYVARVSNGRMWQQVNKGRQGETARQSLRQQPHANTGCLFPKNPLIPGAGHVSSHLSIFLALPVWWVWVALASVVWNNSLTREGARAG